MIRDLTLGRGPRGANKSNGTGGVAFRQREGGEWLSHADRRGGA